MAVTATDTAVNGSASPVATEATQASEAPAQAPAAATAAAPAEGKRWPGWPGDSVFRLIVPVLKVGSIIGRKGELIKKLCEETRARVRILDGAIGTNERIVLVSGREEPDAEISPAMDAVLRIFKRISIASDSEADATTPASTASAVCSIRLLVASYQAINLIGKHGTTIKSIQDNSGATVRVLTGDELPFYATTEERVVDIKGEPLKVLKALEAVVGHLRKFLVDHSVLPLFEKSLNAPVSQDQPVDPWGDKTQSSIHTAQQTTSVSDYPVSLKRDSRYLDPEPQLDSQIHRSGLSYGQDPTLSGLRTSGLGRTPGALVTQITQTMRIPQSYAEDIIGVGGGNIAYIRRYSGAAITLRESREIPDEIIVEIKGTSTEIQTAERLVMDCIGGHKEPAASGYGGLDTGLRSSYSHAASTAYPSSYLSSQSTAGGYGSFSGYGGGYRI